MTTHLLAAAAAAGDSPSWYWYATRGLGASTLLVLTGTVVLGIVTATRWIGQTTPGFVAADMHRNLSLLGVLLLAAHIVTTVLDPFAHIGVRDVIIPVGAAYRPVWLGLGVAAMWVVVAVAASSLLRNRVGPRVWRLIHWAAYASWPLAVIHGLGTGSDAKAPWFIAIVASCVVGCSSRSSCVLAKAGWRRCRYAPRPQSRWWSSWSLRGLDVQRSFSVRLVGQGGHPTGQGGRRRQAGTRAPWSGWLQRSSGRRHGARPRGSRPDLHEGHGGYRTHDRDPLSEQHRDAARGHDVQG